MTLNPWRAGFAFGAFLALWHLLWSLAVAFGAAQVIIDFVMWIHFLDLNLRIAPFSAGLAAILVLVTGGVGLAIGYVFALIWNWVQEAGVRQVVGAGR